MNTPQENKHLIEGATLAIKQARTWEWFHNVENCNETKIFMSQRVKALWERLAKYRLWYDISNF